MTLDLSDTESMALQMAVRTRLEQLQDELVHTDDRAYRGDVRHMIEQLEAVMGRFTGAAERNADRVD